MASFVEGDQSGGAGNWFEQNRPSPTGLVNPGQPIPGYDYPTGASTPTPTATTPGGYLPYPGGSPPTGGQVGIPGGPVTPGQQAAIQAGATPAGQPKTYQEAQAAFNQLFPGETLTPQMLQDHKAELEALGFQLRPNAQGVVGKIQWGNEPIVDVIQGAGSGLNKKQWLTGAPIPGGGGGALGGLAGGYQGGFGGMVAPWTEQFQARDPNQIMQDPAYQFQLKEGLRGVQSGAAAKGTLLTGGTLKALEGYGQGLASTYNDKYYGRDVGEYGMRKENFYQNQDRPFDKFFTTAQLGKPSPA